MRRLFLFAILALCTSPLLATESNPTARQRELIDQILRATNVDKLSQSMLDSVFAQFEKQFVEEAQAKGSDPDDIGEAKELFASFREHSKKIKFDELLHDAQVRLYARYFTESELQDLATFYDSPTGKKTIEVMPQLMADAMKLGVDTITPKIQEVIADVRKEQEQKRPWRRTMSDMRTLATSIEAYQEDQKDHLYPAATDLASLKTDLEDITKSEEFPETDVWGHPYAYVVSPDRHHYRIVSAGADGIFEWDSRRLDVPKEGNTPALHYRDRLEDDLIYADGAFVQLPVQAKPKTKN